AVLSALEEHHRQSGAADADWDIGERFLERRYGSHHRTSFWHGGDFALGLLVIAFAIVIAIAIMVMVICIHGLASSLKALSCSEDGCASSTRPRTGLRAFSTRTSETPERLEPIKSCGTLRPRAFALISTCLGERISVFVISSCSRPRFCRAACAAFSSRQVRSARPAES